MASFFGRFARHKNVVAPALASTVALVSVFGDARHHKEPEQQSSANLNCFFSFLSTPRTTALCEAAQPKTSNHHKEEASTWKVKLQDISDTQVALPVELDFDQPLPEPQPGFHPQAQGYFYDMIPMAQLFQPKVDYPMWDKNWDGREPKPTGHAKVDARRARYLRKHGVTRHIILVRHGQYDERHKDDHQRLLTKLGQKQAHETGKRIAQMIKGIEGDAKSPCNVKVLRVSDLARAKETADIIASHIPHVQRADPEPLLNEGRPCHSIPCSKVTNPNSIEKTQQGHDRIEEAYRTFFYRADEIAMPENSYFLQDKKSADAPSPPPVLEHTEKHEYEIIVCHANVIRYFTCRALQLPPEAWLRLCTFNCSLTYLTIRPTGGVSCRMLGDVGHLKPKLITFSGHHGYNW